MNTTPKALRALIAYAAMRATAGAADFWVQTDHQAKHKADKTPEGRRALAAHAIRYGATQLAGMLAADLVLGTNIKTSRILQAAAFSTATHWYIDQREPVKDAAYALGKRKFHDMAPPLGGAFNLDQSAHHVMEAIASLIAGRD